ncbi:zona pellucida sperm-binding protein 3-like [Cololabis saira]|uniref:zona pellucida sperm-binding protein 3-like n=1 Tax=Cololabis saira TaxID=129043 RepID=UPI002AD58F62|nr:zona pellucida sperm-binding protein 3-like [Cololabis saira]
MTLCLGDRALQPRLSGTGSASPSPASFHSPVPVTPPSRPPVEPDARIQSDIADVPDVSVTCSTSDFVLRVKPAFYGLGADAQELTLGRSCKSNGVLKPQGDLLFQYPLRACDGARELSGGYVVYKNVLHYQPSAKRLPIRANQLEVNIECHYQRDHSVHQLAVQPTWQTVIVHKKLKGRPMGVLIKLTDDSWEEPAKTQSYLLGQTVNVQVSAPQLLSEEKLYINSCYATPSSGSKSSLKYTIIDNCGCMLDSKQDPGASQFVSRTHNTVRFSLKAFQFTADPDTEVSIHCKVLVTSEGPGPAHKSCTYKDHSWRALSGDDSICECCESRCVTSKPRRALMEGSASSRPLLVSDHLYTAEDSLSVGPSAVKRKEDAEMHHGEIWESADMEKHDAAEIEKRKLGREPDLDELGYRKRVFEDWTESKVGNINTFGEDGTKEFSQPEEAEVRFEEISEKPATTMNEKEGEMNHRWMKLEQTLPSQTEPQLDPSESEKGTHNCKANKCRRMMDSQVQLKNDSSLTDTVNGEEKTWYFPWR